MVVDVYYGIELKCRFYISGIVVDYWFRKIVCSRLKNLDIIGIRVRGWRCGSGWSEEVKVGIECLRWGWRDRSCWRSGCCGFRVVICIGSVVRWWRWGFVKEWSVKVNC